MGKLTEYLLLSVDSVFENPAVMGLLDYVATMPTSATGSASLGPAMLLSSAGPIMRRSLESGRIAGTRGRLG